MFNQKEPKMELWAPLKMLLPEMSRLNEKSSKMLMCVDSLVLTRMLKAQFNYHC